MVKIVASAPVKLNEMPSFVIVPVTSKGFKYFANGTKTKINPIMLKIVEIVFLFLFFIFSNLD